MRKTVLVFFNYSVLPLKFIRCCFIMTQRSVRPRYNPQASVLFTGLLIDDNFWKQKISSSSINIFQFILRKRKREEEEV